MFSVRNSHNTSDSWHMGSKNKTDWWHCQQYNTTSFCRWFTRRYLRLHYLHYLRTTNSSFSRLVERWFWTFQVFTSHRFSAWPVCMISGITNLFACQTTLVYHGSECPAPTMRQPTQRNLSNMTSPRTGIIMSKAEDRASEKIRPQQRTNNWRSYCRLEAVKQQTWQSKIAGNIDGCHKAQDGKNIASYTKGHHAPRLDNRNNREDRYHRLSSLAN